MKLDFNIKTDQEIKSITEDNPYLKIVLYENPAKSYINRWDEKLKRVVRLKIDASRSETEVKLLFINQDEETYDINEIEVSGYFLTKEQYKEYLKLKQQF